MGLSPHWFMKEDFLWRSLASLAWIAMLMPFFTTTHSLLLSFNPLHPVSWLTEWFSFVFSFKMLGMVTILAFSSLFITFLNVRHTTVIPVVRRNRLSYIADLVDPFHALQVMAVTLSAALTAWSMTAQMGNEYSTFTRSCSGIKALCLNEKHFLIIIHAGFIGLIFAVQFFLQHDYIMAFSPVQLKFFKVRDFIYPSLIQCGVASMKRTVYFYILYFLMGGLLKSWILTTFKLHGTVDAPLNSLQGFLEFSLLWKLWLVATLFTFIWKLGIYLFKVYHSESYTFAIDTSYADQLERCLHSVMSPRAPPLVRHLAFLDLSILSRYSLKRRTEVFALSQPGHHSHNWNRILAECLSAVFCLTNHLSAHTRRKMVVGAVGSNGTNNHKAKSADIQDVQTPQTPRHREFVQSIGPSIGQVQSPYSSFSQEQLSPQRPIPPPVHQQNSQPKKQRGPMPYVKRWFETIAARWIESMRNFHVVVYLSKPFPDSEQGMIFRESQLQQWALEGLSNLAVASYDEDTYGVVQQSLPEIISAMLALHVAMSKYSKLSQSPSSIHTKSASSRQDSAVHKLQAALQETLTTSIHRIVAKFRHHLKGVQLSTEDERRLSQFINYIE
ncbi:nucleoporin NDC1-like isoform X2 [Anneissia japonica]|uniref:nucleoporin NDC1-like isoform X2 n=1 Tax=Anneissia japonica TaxID=1529436 RepID=UPI0014255676|nr:nucleoporin NDC1-like isoform X2 [Anneissia japonica]